MIRSLEDIERMEGAALRAAVWERRVPERLLENGAAVAAHLPRWQPYQISLITACYQNLGVPIPSELLKAMAKDEREAVRDLVLQVVGLADAIDEELISLVVGCMQSVLGRGESSRAGFAYQCLLTVISRRFLGDR